MDVLDLFIGSEGTLGVVTEATLRVIPKPQGWIALVVCGSEAQAMAVTAELRGAGGIDVAGVEYVDAVSVRLLNDEAWTRAQIRPPAAGATLLLVQLEAGLDEFAALLQRHGAADGVAMASRHDTRAAARLFELREAVPVTVNRLVAEARARDPRIEKTAADMVVPFDQLAASLDVYRSAFQSRGLEVAVWGHVSDGNLHPNLIPHAHEDVRKGREAILEIAKRVIALGGSPLAEHGVGRSPVKQALLRALYGEEGLNQMRAVKRALDPEWKLADGVIFPRATQP
jgi:D-lactate dehydrogenase (cytochrome)